jgi:hypothetical protein
VDALTVNRRRGVYFYADRYACHYRDAHNYSCHSVDGVHGLKNYYKPVADNCDYCK